MRPSGNLPRLHAHLQEPKALAAKGRRSAGHGDCQGLLRRMGEVVVDGGEEIFRADLVRRRQLLLLKPSPRQLEAAPVPAQRRDNRLQPRIGRRRNERMHAVTGKER